MRRRVLFSLLLAACGSTPASTCRSNADCPIDRVCLAGACSAISGGDTGVRDASGGTDSGITPLDANVDAPVGPPAGESCANPILLVPVDGPGGHRTIVWNGELGDYADDAFPDCSGPDVGAPDIVFEIEVPTDVSDIVITTSPPGLDTIMAVDDACDGRFAWACNDDRDPTEGGGDRSSGIFLWHFSSARADRLFLIVDGTRSVTSGALGVQVDVLPAASSDCAAPLDISGGGTVLAFPDSPPNAGDCTGMMTFGDVVFRIADGTAPVGRITTESSDFPVSLRLADTECGTSGTMCFPTTGPDTYHQAELGPLAVEGYGFVAVEGISAGGEGTFWLDYDP